MTILAGRWDACIVWAGSDVTGWFKKQARPAAYSLPVTLIRILHRLDVTGWFKKQARAALCPLRRLVREREKEKERAGSDVTGWFKKQARAAAYPLPF